MSTLTENEGRSKWTHAICAGCWNKQHPNRQVGPREQNSELPEICCYCSGVTFSGIYVREDPNGPTVVCGGKHE